MTQTSRPRARPNATGERRTRTWHRGLGLMAFAAGVVLAPACSRAQYGNPLSELEKPYDVMMMEVMKLVEYYEYMGDLGTAINYCSWSIDKFFPKNIIQPHAEDPKLTGFKNKLAALRSRAGREQMQFAAVQAKTLEEFGKFREAVLPAEKAADLALQQFGPDNPITAMTRINLAVLCHRVGEYDRAETLLLSGLQTLEVRFVTQPLDVARCAESLAALYQDMGQYARASQCYQRALAIYRGLSPDNKPAEASVLNNLAALYRVTGQYDDAERLMSASLEIRRRNIGTGPAAVADTLDSLADLFRATGRYAKAESYYREALGIRVPLPGAVQDAARTLSSLADLLHETGRDAEAGHLHLRALGVLEGQLGPGHPDVARSLSSLADLCRAAGRYAEAEARYRTALGIREARLGPGHPDVARSLSSLADLLHETGRDAEAGPLHLRALGILEGQLGPDHPDVARSLSGQSVMYAAMSHWAEAARSQDRARRTLRRHISRVLPALAEEDQLIFLDTRYRESYHQSLSFGLARRDDPGTPDLSAGWVLNGKSMAQEALAGRASLARDGRNPGASRLGLRLRAVRGHLAALTLTPPKLGHEASRRLRVAGLAAHEQELAKQLGQAVGRPNRDDPWIETDEVRQALPRDAVLVEIARFHDFNFEATEADRKWHPPRYVVWIIPARDQGEIQVIDLGEAEPIEVAVAAARQALQPDPATLRTRGEPDCEQQLRQPLEDLARLILWPLQARIGSTRHWVLSPDAALWLVPWAALPLTDGRYAIEQFSISYAVSGRDLIWAGAKGRVNRPLVMADPDYDLRLAEERIQDRRLRRGGPATPAGQGRRGTPDPLARGTAPRLRGTAGEALASVPSLKSYTKAEPALYLDRQALESVFKSVKSPQVVVLCTHGYFLEDRTSPPADVPAKSTGGRPSRVRPAPENPLLRCGLLLAGANRPRRAHRRGDEDGVLTGLEIVGTDLSGTELVVLSACETGVGQVRHGEGVAGLRQAFQLAGARAVVATLWQIPDKESARLMAGFFDNLAAGKGRSEALHEAQMAMIRSRRERYDGAAHPYFWAAYTITGR